MYKILALDGGGIRSVFQARLLDRIEKTRGEALRPDFYAGTSGGSIVACGLQKLEAADVVRFFQKRGPQIFRQEPFLEEIDDLWDLQGAKYYNKALKSSLTEVFAEMTLSDLKTPTLLTSFAVKHADGYWQPVVFHNFEVHRNARSLSIVDALLRSTAAPTYFPVYQNHCDGGIWGNNPAMAAVAAAMDSLVGNKNCADIVVLSIGTGRRPTQLQRAKKDMGAVDWFQSGVIDMMLDGNIEASHYYTRSLLGARYHRVQIDLKENIELDDAKSIDKIIRLADAIDLQPILGWMQGFWI